MKLLVNNPAFSGLKPIKLKIVKKKIKLKGLSKKIVLRKIQHSNKKSNFFFLKEDKEISFLKKIKKKNLYSKKFLCNIHAHLIKNKINVASIKIENKYKKFFKEKDEYIYLKFQYLRGKFINNECTNLKLLAKELYKFHNKIKIFNSKDLIKINTLIRLRKLEKERELFLKNFNEKDLLLKKVYKILKKENNFFKFVRKNISNSIPTHGDLVPGNILLNNNNIFFIDLEDTHYSYFPVEMDIALIIERLILCSKLSKKEKKKRIEIFIKNYLEKKLIKSFNCSLIKCIQHNSYRSILMLISNYNKHKSINKKEINKFIKLFSSNISFLKQIDKKYFFKK